MKNRIIALLCAVMLALGALSPPAFAAQGKTQYPVSVEEYTEDGTDAHRIKKVYQLSLSDDPAGIPTEDFERDGVLYRLLDLTMKNEIGVDLLSADKDLYARTQNCFCRHGIELDYATVRGISPRDYALLSAAKGIYTGASGVMLDDLANAEVVDAKAFILIVNAMLIARYGPAVLGIRERSRA